MPNLVPNSGSSPTPLVKIEESAPYTFDSDVIFICVDVEAYERNHHYITEIGFATLDTRDIRKVAPSSKGKGWFEHIRARHFRIKENMRFQNTDFVAGCADRFEFGESEIILEKDASRTVASCFKEPFSKRGVITKNSLESDPHAEKRNIIFVGHNPTADVNYLQQIGYNILNLSNLVEVMDTALMWRALTREPNQRALGGVLYELDIAGWNLHNAGNDAVYTMQAMLAICIKDVQDQDTDAATASVQRQRINEERVTAAKQVAEERAREDAEGWSMDEGDDGGVALKPGHMVSTSRPTAFGVGGREKGKSVPKPTPHVLDEAVPARLAGVFRVNGGDILDV